MLNSYSTMLLSRNFRLPRIWSNVILKQLGVLFSGEIVNVSGWDDRDKEGGVYKEYFPHAAAYYRSNYEGERGMEDTTSDTNFYLDLSKLLSTELTERFDVVFNHTTLEHIFDVRLAFRNLCSMSRDVVIIVVPFAQEMHFTSSYGDYWRFTPMCLRTLFQENNLSVIFEAVSSFPNAGVYLVFVGSRYPERWREKMPALQPITQVGKWIGRTRVRSVLKKFVMFRKGLKSGSEGSG